MARKAILDGGKRDEIIAVATKLFFTEGFEGTSVRKILAMVGGEIGMFYHYFASKEELFNCVVERFFRQYALDFEAMAQNIRTKEEFVNVFLPSFAAAMENYRRVENNMHWTIRFALHERTVVSLIPAAEELLKRFGYQGVYPLDIAASKTVADFSAAIHSVSFRKMNEKEQKQLLIHLLDDNLNHLSF